MDNKEIFKKVATDFFYHWWNEDGNNTSDGFDKWWVNKGEELVKNLELNAVVQAKPEGFHCHLSFSGSTKHSCITQCGLCSKD